MNNKHLKLYKWIDIDILYLILYVLFLGLLYYFVTLDNKEYLTPSYNVIPENDSLLLMNNMDANDIGQNNFNSANAIQLTYSPIHSVSSTFNKDKNHKLKVFKFRLQELNIQPTLIETKINRVKVSLSNYYEIPQDERLVTLKFKEISTNGNKWFYQFAYSPLGNYDDFSNNNILTVYLPLGKVDLYIRAIDIKNKTVTKFTKITAISRIQITKRKWFYPIISIFIFLPFLLFIHDLMFSRRKYLMREKLALEQQRCKITADLHDEIGSSLSSLQINSAVANSLIEKNPKEAKKILEKIELQSEQISDKIGDIIWSMKPGKDEFLSLTSRIKNFVNDILGSTNIDYTIKIDAKADNDITNISIRRNIVLFIKEATNNVAKYSKASVFELKFNIVNKEIQIEISDNGIGFDTTLINGNGLGNMKKRIEELNGQFDIHSDALKGTFIKAIIPLIP